MLAVLATPTHSQTAVENRDVVQWVNSFRSAGNIKPVKSNRCLNLAAQTKANDMAAKGYFSHNTPDGHSPWVFVTSAKYQYQSIGENIALGVDSGEEVVKYWYRSPAHRAVMLNSKYTDIGVAVAHGTFEGRKQPVTVMFVGVQGKKKCN